MGNAGESLEFATDKDEESEVDVIGHSTSEVEQSNASTAGKSGDVLVSATVSDSSM